MALDDTTREVQEKAAEPKTLRPGSDTAITRNSDNQLAIDLKAHKGDDTSLHVLQGPKGEDFKIAEAGSAEHEHPPVVADVSVKPEKVAVGPEAVKNQEQAIVASPEAVKSPEQAIVASPEAVKNQEQAIVASPEAVKSQEPAIVANSEAVKGQEKVVVSPEQAKNPEVVIASAEPLKSQDKVAVASEPVVSQDKVAVASEPVVSHDKVALNSEPVKNPEHLVAANSAPADMSPEAQAAVLKNLQLAMTEHVKPGTESFLPASDKTGVAGELSTIGPPPLANPLRESDLQTQVISTDVVAHPNQPQRDGLGHITALLDAQGHKTSISYDVQGNPSEIQLAQGLLRKGADGLWTGSHGETFKDIKVSQDNGGIIAHSLNGDVTVLNTDGSRTVFRPDDTGFNYNAGGQLTSIDRANGGVRDTNGLPSSANRLESSSFVYGNDGALAGVKTAKGAFSLDASGQVLAQHTKDFTGPVSAEPSFNKVTLDNTSGAVTLERASSVTAGASYKEIYYPTGASEIRKADGSSILRNSDGSLSVVADNQGQALKFDYQAGQVSRIATAAGEWNVRDGKVIDTNGVTVGDKVSIARDGVVTFVDSRQNTNTIHPDGSRTINDHSASRDLKLDATGRLIATNEWADASKATFKYGGDGKVAEVGLKDGNWKRESEIDQVTGAASWVNQESGKKWTGVVNLESGTFKPLTDSSLSATNRTTIPAHGDGEKASEHVAATVSVTPNRIETTGQVLEKNEVGGWTRSVVSGDGSLAQDKNFNFKGDIKVDANTSNQLWVSADGRYTSLKFPNGDYTDFYKGEDGRFSKIVSVREGMKTEHAYNGSGTVSLNTRGVPEITDDRGRITALEAPGKWSTRDVGGNLLGVSDGKAIYKFDEAGSVKSVSAGRAVLERDETGTWQRYTLDENKQKVADASYKGFAGKLDVNPTTYVQTWSSNDGRQVTVKEPQGRTIDTIYADGGVIQKKVVAEADGSRLESNFNSHGTLLNVINKDATGNTIAVSDTQQRRMTLAYDGQGNVHSITDSRGVQQVLEPGQKGVVQANGSVVIADSRNNTELTVRPDGRTLVNPESGSKVVFNPDGEVKYVSLRTPQNLDKVAAMPEASGGVRSLESLNSPVKTDTLAKVGEHALPAGSQSVIPGSNQAAFVKDIPATVNVVPGSSTSNLLARDNALTAAGDSAAALAKIQELKKLEVAATNLGGVTPPPVHKDIVADVPKDAAQTASVKVDLPPLANSGKSESAVINVLNPQSVKAEVVSRDALGNVVAAKPLEGSVAKVETGIKPGEQTLPVGNATLAQPGNQAIVQVAKGELPTVTGAANQTAKDIVVQTPGDNAAVLKAQELKTAELTANVMAAMMLNDARTKGADASIGSGVKTETAATLSREVSVAGTPAPMPKDGLDNLAKDGSHIGAVKGDLPPLAGAVKPEVVVPTNGVTAAKVENVVLAANNPAAGVKSEFLAKEVPLSGAAIQPISGIKPGEAGGTTVKTDLTVKADTVLAGGNTTALTGTQVPKAEGAALAPVPSATAKDGIVLATTDSAAVGKVQDLKANEVNALVLAALLSDATRNAATRDSAALSAAANQRTDSTTVAKDSTSRDVVQPKDISVPSAVNPPVVSDPVLARDTGKGDVNVLPVGGVKPEVVLAREATPAILVGDPVGGHLKSGEVTALPLKGDFSNVVAVKSDGSAGVILTGKSDGTSGIVVAGKSDGGMILTGKTDASSGLVVAGKTDIPIVPVSSGKTEVVANTGLSGKTDAGSGLVVAGKTDASSGLVVAGKTDMPIVSVTPGKTEIAANTGFSGKTDAGSGLVVAGKTDMPIVSVTPGKSEIAANTGFSGKTDASSGLVVAGKTDLPIVPVTPGKTDATGVTVVAGKTDATGGIVPPAASSSAKDGIIIAVNSQGSQAADANLNLVPVKNADTANSIAIALFKDVFLGGGSSKDSSGSANSDSSKQLVVDSSSKQVASNNTTSQYSDLGRNSYGDSGSSKAGTGSDTGKVSEKSTLIADAGTGSSKDGGYSLAKEALPSGFGNVTRLEGSNVLTGGSGAKDTLPLKVEETAKKGEFSAGSKVEIAQENKTGIDSKVVLADSSKAYSASSPVVSPGLGSSAAVEGGKSVKEVASIDSHSLTSSSSILARDSAQSGGVMNVAKLDGFVPGTGSPRGDSLGGKVDVVSGKSELPVGKMELAGGKSELSAGKVDVVGGKSELSVGKPEFLAEAGKQIVDVSAKQIGDGTRTILVSTTQTAATGILGESVKAAPVSESRGVVNQNAPLPVLARESVATGNIDSKPLVESGKSTGIAGGGGSGGSGTSANSSSGIPGGSGVGTGTAQPTNNANSALGQAAGGLSQPNQQLAGQGSQGAVLGHVPGQTSTVTQTGNQNSGLPSAPSPANVAGGQGNSGQQYAQQSNSGVAPTGLTSGSAAIPVVNATHGTTAGAANNSDPSPAAGGQVLVGQASSSGTTSTPVNLGAGTSISQPAPNLPTAAAVPSHMAQQAVSQGNTLSSATTSVASSTGSLPGSTVATAAIPSSVLPSQTVSSTQAAPVVNVASSGSNGQNAGAPDPSSQGGQGQVVVSSTGSSGLTSSTGSLGSLPAGSLPVMHLGGQTAAQGNITTSQGSGAGQLLTQTNQSAQTNQTPQATGAANVAPTVSLASATPGHNQQALPQAPNLPANAGGANSGSQGSAGGQLAQQSAQSTGQAQQGGQASAGVLPAVNVTGTVPQNQPNLPQVPNLPNAGSGTASSNNSSNDPSPAPSPQLAQHGNATQAGATQGTMPALPTVVPGLPVPSAGGAGHNLSVGSSQASSGAISQPSIGQAVPGVVPGFSTQSSTASDNFLGAGGSNILTGSSFSNAHGSGNLSFATPAENAGGHASLLGASHQTAAETSGSPVGSITPALSVARADSSVGSSLPAAVREANSSNLVPASSLLSSSSAQPGSSSFTSPVISSTANNLSSAGGFTNATTGMAHGLGLAGASTPAAGAASGQGAGSNMNVTVNTTGSAMNNATSANLTGLTGNNLPANNVAAQNASNSGGIGNMVAAAGGGNAQMPSSISNISPHSAALPNSSALPSVSIAGMNQPVTPAAGNVKASLPGGTPAAASAAVAAANHGAQAAVAQIPASVNTPNSNSGSSASPITVSANSGNNPNNSVVPPVSANTAVNGVVLPAGVQVPPVPGANAANVPSVSNISNLPNVPVSAAGVVLPSVSTSAAAGSANVSGVVLPSANTSVVPSAGVSVPLSSSVLPASGTNNDPASTSSNVNINTNVNFSANVNAAVTGSLPGVGVSGLAAAASGVAGSGTGGAAPVAGVPATSAVDPAALNAAGIVAAGQTVIHGTTASAGHGSAVSQQVVGHVLPEGQVQAHAGHGAASLPTAHSATTAVEGVLLHGDKPVAHDSAAVKPNLVNWLDQANAHLGLQAGHGHNSHAASGTASGREAAGEAGNSAAASSHNGVKASSEPRIDIPSVSEGVIAEAGNSVVVRNDYSEPRVSEDLSVIDNRILEVRQAEEIREASRIERVKEEAAERYELLEAERRRVAEEAQERYEQTRRDELKRVEEERIARENAEKERRLADEMAFMLVMRQRQEAEEKERVIKQKQEREYFQELVRRENTQEKHVVRANEDVTQIAQIKFKDSRVADLIYEMNRGKIEVRWINGRRVYVAKVGQVLILPSQKQVREWLSRYEAISAKYQAPRGMTSQTASEHQDRRDNVEKLLGKLQEDGKREGNHSYFVRLGDTLRSIAMKHPDLKDVTLWRLLAIKNGLTTDTDSKGAPLAVLIRGADLQIPTEEEIAEFKRALKGEKSLPVITQAEKLQAVATSQTCDKECSGCMRLVARTARFCPACGFAFQSDRPQDTTFPLPQSTVPTTPFLSDGRSSAAAPVLEGATTMVDGLGNPEDNDSPDTSVLEDDQSRTTLSFADGTVKVAPHAESPSKSLTRVKDVLFDKDAIVKEVSSLIDKLNDNCRLIKAEKMVDGNIIHCQQLEVYVDEKWLPVLVYEVGIEASVRHEFSKDGRKKSIKIDLPAIAVDEMVKNELERNWQEYCKRYLAGRRLSA